MDAETKVKELVDGFMDDGSPSGPDELRYVNRAMVESYTRQLLATLKAQLAASERARVEAEQRLRTLAERWRKQADATSMSRNPHMLRLCAAELEANISPPDRR